MLINVGHFIFPLAVLDCWEPHLQRRARRAPHDFSVALTARVVPCAIGERGERDVQVRTDALGSPLPSSYFQNRWFLSKHGGSLNITVRQAWKKRSGGADEKTRGWRSWSFVSVGLGLGCPGCSPQSRGEQALSPPPVG